MAHVQTWHNVCHDGKIASLRWQSTRGYAKAMLVKRRDHA